ncbi:hypothetical protein [Sulfurimonas sp.]|uniref:hypothetical protein n=1 Tax=Sulfurimonas sp. TaxID=2022749 RepID=UPI002620A544|nr:hypothetical protein [Sulfurimonas sp.]MDD5157785.1 hypothetical protein [Sulfurimonas sp.]
MKRILLLLALSFSLSFGSISVQGVYFSDFDENATTYLISYYPKIIFSDLGLSSTRQTNITDCRNSGTSTLGCLNSKGFVGSDFLRLREQSHLIDWSLATNALGINQRDFNYMNSLSGVLFGFVFLFFMVLTVVNISSSKRF